MRITPCLPILFAAAAGSAAGQTVNIDFERSAASTPYQGLAAAPDAAGATAIWNGVTSGTSSISIANLVNSQGQATSVGLQLSLDGTFQSAPGQQELGPGGIYGSLMSDYVYLSAPDETQVRTQFGTITGLAPGGLYEVYLYGQGDKFFEPLYSEGQNGLYTINGVSKQTGWDGVAGGNGTLTEGVEYVRFIVSATAGGEIAFSWSNVVSGLGGNVLADLDGANSRFAAINAMQIIAIPEPSAAFLAMIGTLGLMRRRRL